MPPRAPLPALPADLLARTPEEAVRRIAHELLAQAAEARERLADPGDVEALHDFRVAIRRLRSTERAYRDVLRDSVDDRARRRMRKVAHATGGSRDLEVHLAWLDGQRTSLNSRHRPGALWLRDHWRARKVDADAQVGHAVGAAFERLHQALAKRLPVYWQKVRIDAPLAERRFAALLANRLREASGELGERLAAIDGPESIEAAHEARIAAKRVRYLLEPVLGLTDSATSVLKRLRKLQDLLGELHDLDVLAIELADVLASAEQEMETSHAALARAIDDEVRARSVASAASVPQGHEEAPSDAAGIVPDPWAAVRAEADRDAAARRAALDARDPRPGLLLLTRRARLRREALFGTLAEGWLGRDGAALVATLDSAAGALEAETAARSAPLPMEIERKYLLRAIPHAVRGRPSVEIMQGWLPGERLLERVRRVQRGDATQYFRTVKFGSGLSRIELEEETTPGLFDVLWPTTRDRRVRKRRYALEDGGVTWEVDVFAGRDLVLAEVELPSADTAVVLPDWLAPYVVREVTDDAAYVNANLAAAESEEPAAPAHPPRGDRARANVRTALGPRPDGDGATR